MRWTEALAVGVAEVDEHHRELFERVERLEAALAAGNTEAVGELLVYLELYVLVHFGAEERLMSESAYPRAAAHRRQHEAFIARLDAIKRRLETEGPSADLVAAVRRHLGDWLVHHVAGWDVKIGEHLRGLGR